MKYLLVFLTGIVSAYAIFYFLQDKKTDVESDVLMEKFKFVIKTPQFKELLTADETKNLLATEEFMAFAKQYGKIELINLLSMR